MQDLDALMRLAQRQLNLIEEQASPDKRELKSEDARIMSGDRGPFADKMKDDPFEYEIVGDVCNDKEGIQFKVIGFTNRATARFKRRWTKITKGSTQRSFAKGKYIWKRGPLKGKDSWDILRDKIGGGDVICQLVSEAEGTGKEEKPGKSDEELVDEEDFQVTIGGKKKKPEPEPEPEADKGAPEPVSGSKPGSLKYYIENNTTGMDEDIKNYTGLSDFTPQDPARKFFKDALTNARKKERNQQKYSPANIGYGLMELSDEPRAGLASRRLIAALKLMLNRRFPPGVVDRINDLRSRILNTVAKGDRSVINKIAQDKSDALASELNMPFFGTVTAAPAEEPASDKKPKPGVKPKKTDKVKVPTGNLMNKEVDLAGMKMKITSNRLFLDGKPYKAIGKTAGLKAELKFTKAQGVAGGDRISLAGEAQKFGVKKSGAGEIMTAGLVEKAKQLKSKGKAEIDLGGVSVEIVPASMAEALYMSPDQINIFVLSELKSIGFIEDQKEAAMKITAGKLRQIIREEIKETKKYTFNMYTKDGKPRIVNAYASSEEEARALAGSTFGAYFENPSKDNDLDTNNDGSISVDEFKDEIEDIKDDLEMESFEVLLVKPHGKRVEKRRVHVDVNVAGHETPRESKEAAKKVAAEKYPGYSASFAEFDKVGGLDANI